MESWRHADQRFASSKSSRTRSICERIHARPGGPCETRDLVVWVSAAGAAAHTPRSQDMSGHLSADSTLTAHATQIVIGSQMVLVCALRSGTRE